MSDAQPPLEPRLELIIDQIAVQALVQLGAVPNPMTGKTVIALDRARLNLGLLRLLEEKTAGHLSDAEDVHLQRRLEEIQDALAEREAAS